MDAGFFYVLHDAGDEDSVAVCDRVDIDFNCVFQVPVEEQRILAEIRLDLEKFQAWTEKGAGVSETVQSLIRKANKQQEA